MCPKVHHLFSPNLNIVTESLLLYSVNQRGYKGPTRFKDTDPNSWWGHDKVLEGHVGLKIWSIWGKYNLHLGKKIKTCNMDFSMIHLIFRGQSFLEHFPWAFQGYHWHVKVPSTKLPLTLFSVKTFGLFQFQLKEKRAGGRAWIQVLYLGNDCRK